MANIRVVLDANIDGNGEIEQWETNVTSNNGSIIPYSNDINEMLDLFDETYRSFGGAHTYTLGLSKIGQRRLGGFELSNGTFSSEYKGISYLALNDSRNISATRLRMDIKGTDILNIKIVFDRYSGQYPLEYSINIDDDPSSTYITNDSPEIFIDELPMGEHTIRLEFYFWTKDDTPIAITMIECPEIKVTLDKTSIHEVRTQYQMTADPDHIQYGIIANTGKLEAVDNNGQLYRKVNLGYFNVNRLSAEIYANNNLIQVHKAKGTPFYSGDNSFGMDFTNDIEKINEIKTPEIVYENETTLYQVFCDIMAYDEDYNQTDIDNMLSNRITVNNINDTFNAINLTIKDYMLNIHIPPFTLRQDSLLNQIGKICTVAQLSGCFNDVGNLKFFTARPTATGEEISNVIEIPYEKQRNKITFNLFKDNKYTKVNFDE